MIVYKCDRCDEEIDGNPVHVVRTSLPDPLFRNNKWPERYSHFEFCAECVKNLPCSKPYSILWQFRDTGKIDKIETGIDTYSLG